MMLEGRVDVMFCCRIWSNVCRLLSIMQLYIGPKETTSELQKCECFLVLGQVAGS